MSKCVKCLLALWVGVCPPAWANPWPCGDVNTLLTRPSLLNLPHKIIAAQNLLLRQSNATPVSAAEHRLNSESYFALEQNSNHTRQALFDQHSTAAKGQDFVVVEDLQIGAGPNGVAAALARASDQRTLVVTQGPTSRLAPVFVHLDPHTLKAFQTGARETFEADGFEVPNADNGVFGSYMRAQVRAILGQDAQGNENFHQGGVATAINAHLAGAPVNLLTESRVLYTQLRDPSGAPRGGNDRASGEKWHADTPFRSRVRVPVPGKEGEFFETWVYHQRMTDAGGIGISRQAFKDKTSEDVSRTLLEIASGDAGQARNADSGERLHDSAGLDQVGRGQWRVVSGDMFVKSSAGELAQMGPAGVFLGAGDTSVMSANHALARGKGPVILFQREGSWAAQDPNVQSFVRHLPEGTYSGFNADGEPRSYRGQTSPGESRASILHFESYEGVRLVDASGREIKFSYKTDALTGKPVRDQNGLPVIDLKPEDVARLKGGKTILTIQRRKYKAGEEELARQDQALFDHAKRLLAAAGGGIRDLGNGRAEVTSDYQVSGLGYTLTGFSREGEAQGFGGGTPKYRTVYGNIPGVDHQVPIGLEVAYVEYPTTGPGGTVQVKRVEVAPGQMIVTGVKASQIPYHLRLPEPNGEKPPMMLVTKEELRLYSSKAGNGSPFGIESNAPRAVSMGKYQTERKPAPLEVEPNHDLNQLVVSRLDAEKAPEWRPAGPVDPTKPPLQYDIPYGVPFVDFDHGYDGREAGGQAPHFDVMKMVLENFLLRKFARTLGKGEVRLQFEHEFLEGAQERVHLKVDGQELGDGTFLYELFQGSEGKLMLAYLNGVLRTGVGKAEVALKYDGNGRLKEDSVRIKSDEATVVDQLAPSFLQRIRTELGDINRIRRYFPTAEGHEIDLRVASPEAIRESGLDRNDPWLASAIRDVNDTAISLAHQYGLAGEGEPLKVLRSFRKNDTKAGTVFELGTPEGKSKGYLVLFPEGEYAKGLKYVMGTKELANRGIRTNEVIAAFNVLQGKEHRDFDTRMMIGVLVRPAEGVPMTLRFGVPANPAQRSGLLTGLAQLHSASNLAKEKRAAARDRFLDNELSRMLNRASGPEQTAARQDIQTKWNEVKLLASDPRNGFLQGLIHGDAKIHASDGANNIYFDPQGRATFTGNYHDLDGGLIPKDLAFATYEFAPQSRRAFVQDYVQSLAKARREPLPPGEAERRTEVLLKAMKLWDAEYPLIPGTQVEP